MKPGLRLLCASLALAAAAAAQAHDTWFEPRPDGQVLALGTGTLFPKRESGIDAVYLSRQGCHTAAGTAALRPQGNVDDALLLGRPAGARSCWVQLAPFEIELPADKIALYLKEVRPPQALLDAWAAMQARGLPWRERYTKHARIEFGAEVAASPMDFDMLLAPALQQVGQPLRIQVLRDGQPLAGLAVELRSDSTRTGFWRRTDNQGWIDFSPPLPGRWIARAVDLRLAEDRPDQFDSRFITLAFEVQPRTAIP